MPPGGASARETRAQDILEKLLNKEEFIAVLKFAKDRGLDSDNEIFFLISMLKIFDDVLAQAFEAVARADAGLKRLEMGVTIAEERFSKLVEEEGDLAIKLFAQQAGVVQMQVENFSAITKEMRALREELRVVTTDANRALDAYNAAQSDNPAVSLSRLLFDQFRAELKAHAPHLEIEARALFVHEVRRATRQLLFAIGGATLLLGAFIIWLNF